jgi:hypothetical protein
VTITTRRKLQLWVPTNCSPTVEEQTSVLMISGDLQSSGEEIGEEDVFIVLEAQYSLDDQFKQIDAAMYCLKLLQHHVSRVQHKLKILLHQTKGTKLHSQIESDFLPLLYSSVIPYLIVSH